MKDEKALLFDPQAFLAVMDGGRTIAEYARNKTVYTQGDVADSVFYIQSGKVKISVVSEHGKEAVVALLGAGVFFGEGCVAGQKLRLATATALEKSVIVRIAKSEIIRVIHDEPEFAELFISYLLARNARAEEDLVDQLFNSSEKRLARTLLLLARYGKKDKPGWVLPRISQEALAEMVGTTRSRVNVFMNKFRKLGFVEYNGSLKINPSLVTVVVHDATPASTETSPAASKP
jgi:CRP/FNR family transcriptional regulator, cyclic AMP receptor protein